MEAKVVPNGRLYNGYKLLNAISEENGQEVQELLKGGNIDFNVDYLGDNAIHLAARKGNIDNIKLLHKAGVDLQQKNMHGNTAMHYAARDGYLDIVDFLRTHKVDMNPLNDLDGEAPLHLAVREQAMDVIEALVDLGMDPNIKNKETGNTPLHVALELGAQEAMESLLIKGAKPGIMNNDGKLPADLAKTNAIRSTLQIWESLLISMDAGNIRAICKRITRAEMEKPNVLIRVGVIVVYLDVPEGLHTCIYCRRENVEHATVKIPHLEEEFSFGDVYHIRVFDVNQDCKALLYLPLYEAPSKKEQIIVRFLCGKYDDFVADEYVTSGKNFYVPLNVILEPDTTCICMINIRQRIEERAVGEQEATITSDMDHGFSINIQSGSFKADTVLRLQVIDTNPLDDIAEASDESESEQEEQRTSPRTATRSKVTERQTKRHSSDLLTNLYQINISGDQPKKTVTLTLPLGSGMTADHKIVIIHADETELNKENALEILPVDPQVVNGKIVFEVSQFCVFTSTWLEKIDSVKKMRAVQQSMFDAMKKRKPVSFYALVQQDDEDVTGLRHKVVIECHLAQKSQRQREKWIKKGYAEQNQPETGEIMAAPGDSFVVDILGNVRLDDCSSALTRKIQFLKSRPCQQLFTVRLQENIYDQDDAFGYVMIYKSQKDNTETDEIARLRIMVKPPRKVEDLPSSPVPSVTSVSKKKKKKSKSKKNAQPQDLKMKSAKEKRKPISFYALVQQDDEDATGLRHKVVIECHLAHKSQQQREKWIKKGYAEQNPPETGELMAAPGDSFVADIQGNVRLEDSASVLTRKIQFLKSRPCQQSFNVRLQENIYDQDDAFGYVMIYKSQKDNTVTDEIARLRIMVKPPRKVEDLPSSPVPSVTSVSKKKKKKSKSKKNAQPQDLKIKSHRGSVHTLYERGGFVTDFFARRDSLYKAPSQVSIKPLKDAKKNGITDPCVVHISK